MRAATHYIKDRPDFKPNRWLRESFLFLKPRLMGLPEVLWLGRKIAPTRGQSVCDAKWTQFSNIAFTNVTSIPIGSATPSRRFQGGEGKNYLSYVQTRAGLNIHS